MHYNKGRPHKVPSDDFVNNVVKYKDRVILSDKIVSKNAAVWHDISASLGGKLKPTSLYSMVTSNVHGIRDKLLGHSHDASSANSIANNSTNINISSTTSLDSSASQNEEDTKLVNFIITIPSDEFEELITFKSYKRTQGTKIRSRSWKILRHGIWEDFITQKIWDEVKLKCGFQFRNHYLCNVGTSGYINGKYINL